MSKDEKETKKSELELAKEKMEEYLNGWKRAKAEYDQKMKRKNKN